MDKESINNERYCYYLYFPNSPSTFVWVQNISLLLFFFPNQQVGTKLSTMKFLLTLSVLGAFCTDSASSYISSISPGGAIPWKKTSFAQPPTDVEVDDVFRQEYHAWAHRYGKSTTDKFRFENFKLNYMLQMQQNKRTGSFADLNEFGDSKFCLRKIDCPKLFSDLVSCFG